MSRNGNAQRKLAAKLPELVAQPHGGALLSGGVPGHVGAGGRPRSVVRELCLKSFEDRIPILENIADGKLVELRRVKGSKGSAVELEMSAGASERIKAVEALARAGLGSDEPKAASASITTPDGFTFTLKLGERDADG